VPTAEVPGNAGPGNAGPGNAGPADPFGAARLGPVQLRNRALKAATFEGMSPAGVVSSSLVEFHRRMAAGGVAMTTVSYIAVSRDGLARPAGRACAPR
jgi:2,4-dienoyl-CoA reductase-like NADH-dependent reductase (Old Yellow Enzyme family)